MKKIIVACDSFKGSMSANEVCGIISKSLKERFADAQIKEIPVADGGEGTVDAYLAAVGGQKQYYTVYSPLFNEIQGCLGIIDGDTAVIECASASGITIEKKNNAMLASTYGTGQLIKYALDNGIRKFIIGLGGSATTDAGTGMMSALGVNFCDRKGNKVPYGGIGLSEIAAIDKSNIDKRLSECKFTVLCDVKNPLYGQTGAAYVYAPQKGANENEVEQLDAGLINFATVCKKTFGYDYFQNQGAGAAGGLGFAFMVFCNAEIKRGIDAILEVTDFENLSYEADLVITGEGKMDSQSLCGKVPFGVCAASKAKKCIAIVGLLDNETDMNTIRTLGIDEVYQTNPAHLPFEQILPTCKEDLKKTVMDIII